MVQAFPLASALQSPYRAADPAMTKPFCLLVLTASLLVPRAVRAQVPFGAVAANYLYKVSRLLADPARTRVYISDTTSNSVVVIDTTTLKVVATVPIGSDPVDMAVSLDGNTLYVANSGSTLAAIALLDLNTLTVQGTFSLASAPTGIAAGQGGRIYVSVSPDEFSTAIYQLDGTTGAVQATFNSADYDENLLTLSPDGNTLYVASNSEEPGDLKSFDVSTATPVALQDNSRVSDAPPVLVVSHQGKYLCLPSYDSFTYLYSTTDLNAYYGTLTSAEGSGTGPLAFSPDDSLVYQVVGSDVDIFNTTSFTEVNHVLLPGASEESSPGIIRQMAIDHTGRYLFVGVISDTSPPADSGRLIVIATGTGTLTPPSIVPVISGNLSVVGAETAPFTYQIMASNQPTRYAATGLPDGLGTDPYTGLISGTPQEAGRFVATLQATNLGGTGTASLTITVAPGLPSVMLTANLPAVIAGGPDFGEFTVSLSEAQDHDVVINFAVKGSAVNGTDYALFKGTKKIKAGQTSKPIKIIPQGDLEGAAKKVVTLNLAPGNGYTIGTLDQVKVKIFAPVP